MSLTPHGVTVSGAVLSTTAELPAAAILAIDNLAMTDDPAALLTSWRGLLGPGGSLYVQVPDRPLPGYRLAFTRKSLMLLMERMGFRLITKDRVPHALAGWFRRY